MANKQTQIIITHGLETYQTIVDKLLKASSKPKEEALLIRNFFHALAGTDRNGKCSVQVNSGDGVLATGTITLSSMVATDTLAVGGVTFTCEPSGATGNQFNVGGTDTITAANAVVAINANTTLSPFLVASSSGAVITITCRYQNAIGNLIALAISAHGSVSAAHLANGAAATTYSSLNTFNYGVA